jgi:serine/threonine-protein kinase RsbW
MPPSDMIRLEMPAHLKYLSTLAACVQDVAHRLSEDEGQLYQISLAVNELYSNIIIHACKNDPERRITVILYVFPHQFIVEFYDTGLAFNFPAVSPPSIDPPQERGMGLFLIHHLMDEVSYKPFDQYNLWRLVKKLG